VNNSSPKKQLPNPKNLETLEARQGAEQIEMRASEVTVKVRRSPKFLPFVLSGILLGVVVAFILNALIAPENRTDTNILGYLVLYCAGAGLALGVLAVLALEAFFRARAKQVSATKLER